MRSAIVLMILALLIGCASGNPTADQSEIITHIGVIKSKEVIEPENAGSGRQTNTSVHASVSSGGGFSIGLGFLVSALSGGSTASQPVRYQVELVDGEQLTIFHDSDLFEVEDCVEVSTPVGDSKKPPMMKRLKEGCRAE